MKKILRILIHKGKDWKKKKLSNNKRKKKVNNNNKIIMNNNKINKKAKRVVNVKIFKIILGLKLQDYTYLKSTKPS